MTSVVTCAHDWVRVTGNKPTDVTLTCRRCGAASLSRGKVRGKTVTTMLDLYPARGHMVLEPDVYEFFIRQWEAECAALVHTGFAVERRPPIVHTQAQSGTPRSKEPRASRFVTGRDVLIAAAIVLLGGVAMLTAGIYLDVQWLKVAGGVSLAILFFLLLLVVFLS